MNLYLKKDYELVGIERINEIKEKARKENALYYEKDALKFYNNSINTNFLFPNKVFHQRSGRGKYFTTLPQNSPLINKISYLAHISSKHNLKNDIEKSIFETNGIFSDDEKFINIINKSHNAEYLENLINDITKFDQYNDEKKENIIKNIYLRNNIMKNKMEINSLLSYFNEYYYINSYEIIVNRLLQIYYFNKELYDTNMNKKEKLVIKK